jgi:hypothetical protein
MSQDGIVSIDRGIVLRLVEAEKKGRQQALVDLMTTARGFAIMREAGGRPAEAAGILELIKFISVRSTCEPVSLAEKIRSMLLELSDVDRHEVLSSLGFCRYCGRDDSQSKRGCQCENDE